MPEPAPIETAARPRVVITLGDPNGIGPEVVLKSLLEEALRRKMQPVAVGSAEVLRAHAEKLGLDTLPICAFEEMPREVPDDALAVWDVAEGAAPEVRFGETTAAGGRLSMQAIAAATDACAEGRADTIVTAPISKEALRKAGYTNPGHTEFIAARTGSTGHVMMMVDEEEGLRVGLVTGHVSVAEVPAGVTQEAIVQKLRVMAKSLRQDFGIARPQIAVLGLNPHAGDGGVMGREEIEIIGPSLAAAQKEGLAAEGPFPADGFFALDKNRRFDAVLAMYHDQGLVPFKALAFDRGVNFTAGLPVVRTSPDHGTAFDIAGTGAASPGSMKSALRLALAVARRRASVTTDDERPTTGPRQEQR